MAEQNKSKDKSDVYNKSEVKAATHRHILACLVDNEFGVLARVVGLFSGRGYNIESLTVTEVDESKNLSRITIITSGSDMVIAQIKALLERLVPVHTVVDITLKGEHIERELGLIKVVSTGAKRTEALRIADEFNARVIDSTADTFVFEITGVATKIEEFIVALRPFGLAESCRSGSVAVNRGNEILSV
jgi:acetolactate synthase-1/3 small subunit